MEKRILLSVNGQEIRYWQKYGFSYIYFFSEKGGIEKGTSNADAKLVQWVQSTVLIVVIKPGNKITDGKGGKESISWCEL